MLKNYLKVALRNLFKHKVYSLINVLGLAVGMACCILIFLLVKHEWSFDDFHVKGDRIHRVVIQEKTPEGEISFRNLQPPALYEPILQEFPGILRATRLVNGTVTFVHNGNFFRETLNEVDSSFFQIFSFPLLAGDPVTALKDPKSIVLNETMTQKYFGVEAGNYANVLGQSLEIARGDNRTLFTISGVMKDMPRNSSFQMDFLISFENYAQIRLGGNDWGSRNSLYLELAETQEPKALETALIPFTKTQFAQRIQGRTQGGFITDAEDGFLLKLQPLADLHLNPEIEVDYEQLPHNPLYSYILSGVGALVLLIACINFMTLSMGRSTGRSREVGMRKVLGAQKGQVMKQFWGEALLLSALSLVLGLSLAIFTLSFFNDLTGKELLIADFFSIGTIIGLLAIVLIVALVAGVYPSVILSKFQPIVVMKGEAQTGGKNRLTRGLVVVQYVLAIALMIGTGLMAQQMSFIRNMDLGYKNDHVIAINMGRVGSKELAERFRNETISFDQIVNIVTTAYSFTRGGDRNSWTDANGVTRSAWAFGVDYDYFDILGMELSEGRNFSREITTDPINSVLVNEAFVKQFDFEKPVGTKLTNWCPWFMKEAPTIIGVVKDFHFQSLYAEVKPAVLTMHPDYHGGVGFMLVKVKPERLSETIALLEEKWNLVAPNTPFRHSFLDEDVANQYIEDEKWGKIVGYSSALAILIACLGLFGLASLAVAKRTKEVGIRKVLGASVSNIVMLIGRDFILLIAVAAVLASPLAWYGGEKWLENFAFKTTIGFEPFLFSIILAVAIAALTLSYQAIKAALTNPATTLKYE